METALLREATWGARTTSQPEPIATQQTTDRHTKEYPDRVSGRISGDTCVAEITPFDDVWIASKGQSLPTEWTDAAIGPAGDSKSSGGNPWATSMTTEING
jgi:hypothetical protein